MAQLIVRNLEPTVVRKLKLRAAKEGVSMEEALRRILRSSVQGKMREPRKMSLWEYLQTMPNVGKDSDFNVTRKGKMRVVDLSG
jgi:plasmid stability protein